MSKRAAHLTIENASRFKDRNVVDNYHLRLPYPPETFQLLLNLIRDEPRFVLDVGTGIGNLARAIVTHVDHVDAIDFSAAMIDRGKTLKNGDSPKLNWILGRAEDVIPDNHYSLIMGGQSIHWLDWDVIFPIFADRLTPNGFLALVGRSEKKPEWMDELIKVIEKYSSYESYEPFNLSEHLQETGHFKIVGDEHTPYYTHQQSIDDYIASYHSRAGLAAHTMPPEHVAAFARETRRIVEPYSENGLLMLETRANITWGKAIK